MPVLGKHQFEIVAEGSREFDRYLMKTLHGGDDEIARRDQWRDDHYHDADLGTQLSPLSPAPKIPSSRAPAPVVTGSESEGSEDSESDDEEDDDDNNIVDAQEGSHREAKGKAEEEELTSADFEKFLKFQAMMGKTKMKKTKR